MNANKLAPIALVFSMFACSSNEKIEAAQPTPPAPIDHATEDSSSANQKLALAKVSGESSVDKLLAEAQQAAKANPGKEDLWIALGRVWVKKARTSSDPGFYLNANACADVALEIKPESKSAYDLKGLVLLNDHKFEAARALAEQVLVKNPDDALAYGTLSDSLLELGRYEEAANATQQMIDLKPNLPSYSRASYLQWLRGDSKSALESVRLAIDSGMDGRDREPRAWVLVQAAQIFFARGDYDGADAGMDSALSWDPDFPPALVGKGQVALAKDDGARAAQYLSRAYAQSPLAQTAWLLGDARAMIGDEKGAQAAYAEVEKEGKTSDPRTLSLFYSTRNEHADVALSLAEKEFSVRKDITTEDARAWALYRNGKYADAKTAITHARRLGTKDARIMFHEGAIRIATGDRDGGKKLVADALALSPKFDVKGSAEARAMLP